MLALLLAALPILIVPREAIVEHPSTQQCFATLLELGGHGRRSDERAAFLTWNDGEIGCVVWPRTNEHLAASFRGTWPENTVAIAHTHPRSKPRPSVQDVQEARRLGIPIFVVTDGGVQIAE